MRINLEDIVRNVEVKVEGNELRLSGQIELLGHLWRGRLDAALEAYARIRDEARNPRWINDMVDYPKRRREYIPNYEARRQAGL